MSYLLLNKDSVWLEFHCEQNEYLETTAQEDRWHTSLRPFGYANLTDLPIDSERLDRLDQIVQSQLRSILA